MHLDFLYELLGQYGLYAVFILVMLEGDITLLLAGVLAHSAFFGEYSFARVLLWGTVGGCVSDNLAYLTGRGFCEGVREVRFYRAAKPRLERLTNKFGPLSIFLSKYIYGLRWAACVFYGVGRMPYLRFLFLSLASCFLWVFILSGAGYFFSGAVMGLIGDFQRVGKVLLVIVVLGIVGFYLRSDSGSLTRLRRRIRNDSRSSNTPPAKSFKICDRNFRNTSRLSSTAAIIRNARVMRTDDSANGRLPIADLQTANANC